MTIEEFTTEEFPKLTFFTRQIFKVHGKNHPELEEVRDLFAVILEKNKTHEPVNEEVAQLKKVTANFTIPEDACEGYKTTYELLKQYSELVG